MTDLLLAIIAAQALLWHLVKKNKLAAYSRLIFPAIGLYYYVGLAYAKHYVH